MKFLYDFFPIVLFFVAYKVYDIYVATAVAIGASFLQLALYWLKYRRMENAHLITLVVLVVFGGATLLLHDETFIKWKPTVVNGLLAGVFLGSQFIGKKNIIERMLGANFSLPKNIWRNLNYAWVIFFVFSAVINIVVAYQFDTDTWVNFKLFGMLGLTLVFALGQGIYLSRHMGESDSDKEGSNSENA